jgi:hypothetical protein
MIIIFVRFDHFQNVYPLLYYLKRLTKCIYLYVEAFIYTKNKHTTYNI